MKRIMLATFFLSIMYTPCLLGEATRDTEGTQIKNAVATDADREQAQRQGGQALGDPNTIKRDELSAPSDGGQGSADRAYKAKNAKEQGNTGVAAAVVAASVLAAQSAAAFAALNFGLGAALAAMSALETAQAIATGSTASDNDAQNKQLLKDEQAGSARIGGNENAGTRSKAGSSVSLPPDLESVLNKQGVNVDRFKEQLASGAFTRVDDVIDAIGMSGKVSEYDMKKAEQIADKAIRNSVEQVQNDSGKSSISGNESSLGNFAGTSSSGVSGSSMRESDGSLKNNEIQVGIVNEDRTHSIEQSNSEKNGVLSAGTMTDFLKKFSDGSKQGMLERKLTDYEIQMEKASIFPAMGKGHIFQVAHRNYREFGKWRRNTKLANR